MTAAGGARITHAASPAAAAAITRAAARTGVLMAGRVRSVALTSAKIASAPSPSSRSTTIVVSAAPRETPKRKLSYARTASPPMVEGNRLLKN